MPNDIIQSGTGNFAFKDIFDSEFNIFIGKNYDYQELLHQLKTQEKLLELTPKTEEKERQKIIKNINDLKNRIEAFKQDVLQLADQFNRIEINTERLKRAKEFFDKGEFREARAVLEIEFEQMQAEQEFLLKEKEYFENHVLPNLKKNSEEFLMLALTAKADYIGENRVEEISGYFERSLKSNTDNFNIVEYILFLEENNQFEQAERLRQVTKFFDRNRFDDARIVLELEELSWNYYWSWKTNGIRLWRDLDPSLWERSEQNPRMFLRRISRLRLFEKVTDGEYTEKLRRFSQELEEYLAQPTYSFGKISTENPIAYFCIEYGVHNSLPIYSGGLGILAGDHLKSASDLNAPLVAVGLFYRYGYFRQKFTHDGWQEEHYQDLFNNQLALEPVNNVFGERVFVTVHIRGREVAAQAWLAKIGRIRLYLLDTNIERNDEIDRYITGHLYGGDAETRIVQEEVLGIGGVRLLRALNITPSVYHLNEGHSAFLTLELAREFLQENQESSFADAVDFVREKCVFTTQTVLVGRDDVFSPDLIEKCFDVGYINSLKISKEEFLALGRVNQKDDQEGFGMTPLALRMSRSANAVSMKHGEVSRELWLKMFPEATDSAEVPIIHITNGVHAPTWISQVFQTLYIQNIGLYWMKLLKNSQVWGEAIQKIPDEEIWQAHQMGKELLISFIRQRTFSKISWLHDIIHEQEDTNRLFNPNVLTIGFAGSVTGYKRWNLLMTDLERLLRLVDNSERPIQFVFAGKAHPQDKVGKQLLQNLMSINHDSNWKYRAVFIEDYDHETARYMVQGVDVWMNVPRRPLEASGTSGQKAAMNGVLHFSTLDGWWIEGYNGENGFSIGDLWEDQENDETNKEWQREIDRRDAESLYHVLENEIVPMFYAKDETGLPREWIKRMRNALATLTPQFSCDRMLKEYIEKIYCYD